MPKPYGDMAGSGMHIHLSLTDDAGDNVFDGGAEGPNETIRHAVGGMLSSMAECMLIFAPHHNSYRRFIPGSYAPMVAAWGLDNRGTAVRMPEIAGKGARIEHRVSGSDANPYLLAAAVLAAAIDGIERKLDPGKPVTGEAGVDDGASLPMSWGVAGQTFARSRFVREWLGEEFQTVFAAVKRQERTTLLGRVSDVEYGAYLRTV